MSRKNSNARKQIQRMFPLRNFLEVLAHDEDNQEVDMEGWELDGLIEIENIQTMNKEHIPLNEEIYRFIRRNSIGDKDDIYMTTWSLAIPVYQSRKIFF